MLFGVDKIPADLVDALRSGRMRPADAPGAVPLPALTLMIRFADEGRTQWQITARRATGVPSSRVAPTPWQEDAAFAPAFDTFWRLSRTPIEKAEDADCLDGAAQRLGDALAGALTADEAAFLVAAARGDPPPPLLVIESDDDRVLALPWELIRLDGRFAVRAGRLDVARSVPTTGAPELSPPSAPLSLLVNVSAPAGSGLDYERESYVVVRALHEHLGVVINEMGEVDDLIDGLRGDPPPIGVHFSGHGGPGTLVFEDEYGEARPVEIDALITEIRRRGPERLPRFFFLACCHGGDAPSSSAGGLPAAATALHRDGITQVVGYFGPVLDELSTRAERAFYAELAAGRRTRDAVRAARQEMSSAAVAGGRTVRRDAGTSATAGLLPYGWAQMVLYQRGAGHPLGTRIVAGTGVAIETTERRTVEAYPGSRSQILKAGFVGRRKEMHALRRDLGKATICMWCRALAASARAPFAAKR
ncbi:MAG: CHAT domain-containing protein [Hyphomicrobiales bacterium]